MAKLFIVLAGAWLLSLQALAQAEEPERYELTISQRTFPEVEIEARLYVENGRLHMFPHLNWTFVEDRGFAAFVHDLQVRGPNGRRRVVIETDPSDWMIEGDPTGWVDISYTVDLSYAGRTFSTGNEQVAWHDEDALFATGFALFVMSGRDGPFEIEIRVPRRYDVLTAWEQRGDGIYVAPDQNALMRNVLSAGSGYGAEVLERGGLELRIALFGRHAETSEDIRSVFLPVMDYFLSIFGESEGAAFMFAILPGNNDGESYISSFASSQPEPPAERDRVVWANSLAHEFFHHWNGSRISSVWEHYPERQWFSEGFTEYYANRALLATGVIDQNRYDRILSHYLTMNQFFATSAVYDGVTMRDAGQRKGRNRPGVYDSGVAAAFCLDGIIREQSGGTRTLDDMMRQMNSTYGDTATPIVFEDIVAAASQTAGEDLSDFIAEHVEARTPFNAGACAARMGYRASIDGYHVFLEPLEHLPHQQD